MAEDGTVSRTSTTTRAPSAARAEVRLVPTNPVAPVTATRRPPQKSRFGSNGVIFIPAVIACLLLVWFGSRAGQSHPRPASSRTERGCLLGILRGVHGFPEPFVTVGEQVAGVSQGRKNLAFEILPAPAIEDSAVHNEEPGVDQMVMQLRLLAESAHPSLSIDIEGSVGRRKGNSGYCRCRPVGTGEVQEVVKVNIRQAVGVREKEFVAKTFAPLHDSTTRVGVLARID